MADPPYSLAANHDTAEDIVAEAGVATTFIHPTALMQNLLNDAGTVKEQSAIYSPVSQPMAYVDARDVAAVAATVLTSEGHDGEAYPVTGPEAITYADIVVALSEELGRDIKHVQVGMDDARGAMLDAGCRKISSMEVSDCWSGSIRAASQNPTQRSKT